MYKDIEERLAVSRGVPYREKFKFGLPLGMELPNGVVIGS